MNRIVVIAWAASLALVAWLAWDYRGAVEAETQLAAVTAAIEQANAENAANREKERTAQEEIDRATQQQINETRSRNASLIRELSRLRDRVARAGSNPAAGSGLNCAGATGAELSREDAEFLIGEAARADGLRSALAACYSYADTVAGQ